MDQANFKYKTAPIQFLEAHVLLPNPAVGGNMADLRELDTRVHSFDIRPRAYDPGVYELKFWDMGGQRHAPPKQSSSALVSVFNVAAWTTRTEVREPPLMAYWLPYKANHTYETFLTDEADYFFTAGLTGCTVVVSGDPRRPRVAHVNRVGEDEDRNALRNRFQAFAGESFESIPSEAMTKASTTSREIMHQELKSVVNARMEGRTGDILGVCTWGVDYRELAAVFGFRDKSNGVWSFCFQKYRSGPAPVERAKAGVTFARDGRLMTMGSR